MEQLRVANQRADDANAEVDRLKAELETLRGKTGACLECERLAKERDYLVSEYERAVKCGSLGFTHAASHIYNAIVNAKCDVNADRFIELMDKNNALTKQNAKLREAVDRMNATFRWTHETYCTEEYTGRGLHAPECLLDECEAAGEGGKSDASL
jgi:hypothetical protein